MSEFEIKSLEDESIIARADQIKLALAAACSGFGNYPPHQMALRDIFGKEALTPVNILNARKILMAEALPELSRISAATYYAFSITDLYAKNWAAKGSFNAAGASVAREIFPKTSDWRNAGRAFAVYALSILNDATNQYPAAFEDRNMAAEIEDHRGRILKSDTLSITHFSDTAPHLLGPSFLSHLNTSFTFLARTYALYLYYSYKDTAVHYAAHQATNGAPRADLAQTFQRHLRYIHDTEDTRAELYDSMVLLASALGKDSLQRIGQIGFSRAGTLHLRHKQ
ncbi:MAG: hypothetical protein KGQ41_01270 [Alphaproteobacteria bacterium]|nr:hypothetical protein [Alphaproteobacteria bacterium]